MQQRFISSPVIDCAVFFHLVTMPCETWDVAQWQWEEGEAAPQFS